MNWCGWGTEAIERYRQKLKVIHYRHQGRSAEIKYVWDVLMKRIEADTEAPGLLIAHKEYGILEHHKLFGLFEIRLRQTRSLAWREFSC